VEECNLLGVFLVLWVNYNKKRISPWVTSTGFDNELSGDLQSVLCQGLDSVKDPSRISSWIFRIAYNLCQDHFRQSTKSPAREGISQERMETSKEASVQKELEQRQMGQCVQNHMNLLPESLRTVLILYDIMDFSHQEVAEILGTTIENTKVRLHRARKRFKAILEEQCAFEVDERSVLVCEPTGKTE
jgi:RNA polymerase sigma-70 factor (ECF subfamily)